MSASTEAITPDQYNSEVGAFFRSVAERASALRHRRELVPTQLQASVALPTSQLVSLVASVDSLIGGLPFTLRSMPVNWETLTAGQVIEGIVSSRRLLDRDGKEFFYLTILLDELKDGCSQSVSVVAEDGILPTNADWLLTSRVRVTLGGDFWHDSTERTATKVELVGTLSNPQNFPKDNYRRGYVNWGIKPGVGYVGRLISKTLIPEVQIGDGSDYDKWDLELLLDGIVDDTTPDVIAISADAMLMDEEVFDADRYLGKRVRVVLGNVVGPDTWKRYVISIDLI